ncbi:putative phenylalanine ammonia-lyase [Talaromyces proteolyticus]|uniref:Phenylalanine ammonia-lyase n=1 Tax=Talaromyces proteolyticus TaxID=1131652 RepID=A0AAD4L1J1_9EURO|nr:putative phenylalanine ammonia-lyase [Talaromyces proteolyticus]KAH8705434.1 putative phenylalanine ammonia-lyase [Talaromyces proteolyticus]
MRTSSSHYMQAHSEWTELQAFLSSDKPIVIDGHSLTIAGVVAAALYGKHVAVTDDPAILNRVQQSVDFLDSELRSGRTVYGVTTGFGGSADTRTDKVESLQVALQQHLNVGILLPSDKGQQSDTALQAEGLRSHALPVPIVKGMMIIRCNSLIRGHSGVRLTLIKNILTLLEKGMTPVVPLRGSISASGDLSTLSYIAGMLEGNPDVFVRIGDEHCSTYLSADKALQRAGIQPITLHAKEGLGITNGTSPSCAAGCVAIYQAQQLALMTQLLTAMGTEALLGTAHNFHPFISAARPHQGQTEAAANISLLLSGSRLAPDKNPETIGLAQDRYALRTAPQWIGPQLEDLDLAHRQVQAEVNSTTDNPLLDVQTGAIHHGGNFQAVCITSAMEKTMSAMQMLGKLIFAQSSELVHNKLNKGLPPNLSSDDPSLSFTAKGFDVNMAAYMSELAYLAHPVSSHVQSAEMHNQSVNSLALLTARYALEAVELVSLMSATYIYLLCQALDLRCLHFEFVKTGKPAIRQLLQDQFGQLVADKLFDDFAERCWKGLLDKWESLSHLDLEDRGTVTAKESLGDLVHSFIHDHDVKDTSFISDFLRTLEQYQKTVGKTLYTVYGHTRDEFYNNQTTASYLSPASAKLYTFVRKDLNVPFHRGLIDHPTASVATNGERGPGKILGTLASEIYMAIRNGRLHGLVMDAFTDQHQ